MGKLTLTKRYSRFRAVIVGTIIGLVLAMLLEWSVLALWARYAGFSELAGAILPRPSPASREAPSAF